MTDLLIVVAALVAFTTLGYIHSALYIWLRDKGYDVDY